MLFHRFLLLALLPASFAVPRVARNAATVEKDIALLSRQIIALNKTVTRYTKGNDLDTALRIQDGALTLYNVIVNTTKAVNASKKFTDGESTTIALAVLDLAPKIYDLLDNLSRKKKVFDTSFIPFAPVIINDLRDEQAATDALGAALKKKLTPPFAAVEPVLIAEIDQHFNDTIAVYMKS